MAVPVFDSRDTAYKTPFGALPEGGSVVFTLRPPREAGLFGASLLYTQEGADGEQAQPMLWTGLEGDRDVFSLELSFGDFTGLVRYRFRLDGPGGPDLLGRGGPDEPWQLTVFAPQETPRWFGEGVTYHIFPDRFRRSRAPEALPAGRIFRPDWGGAPEYRPDGAGEIKNCDFFGGDLAGIASELDYLAALGVETIYLCPIFEAAENHRYGTADYESIDPLLGTEPDFRLLCEAAHARGMRVLLDGVFNHTGAISRYFNADGRYGDLGAAQSKDSPYFDWYRFSDWPRVYDAWWGIRSLPAVREESESYRRYIFGGKDAIVRRWLRAGADGWRLDVADELPDDFIAAIRGAAKEEKADAFLLGEVWEDASSKVSYGVRRRHVLGGHLDGVMNYPFRTALLDFLRGGDASRFRDAMDTLRENYPPDIFFSCMNSLGTHDTPRILTLLGLSGGVPETREARAAHRLSAQEHEHGAALLRLAAVVQYAFPGSPSLYYGDEAGLEGFEDPFNRRCYPWGGEDETLLSLFRRLGRARRESAPLRRGALRWLRAEGGLLAFSRTFGEETATAAVNRDDAPAALLLPEGARRDVLTGARLSGKIILPPRSGILLT
ncbi:MAG TPA: glycoside hydrolase family 13 protein [Oscillospiraceae bacterium]|nr:glycoside hydrolase family 13 protein [Oscillospiraceae bacterium]